MLISCAGYLSPTGLYPVRWKCQYPWDVHVISRDIWGLLWDIRTSRQDILRTSQGYPFAVRVELYRLEIRLSAHARTPGIYDGAVQWGTSDQWRGNRSWLSSVYRDQCLYRTVDGRYRYRCLRFTFNVPRSAFNATLKRKSYKKFHFKKKKEKK